MTDMVLNTPVHTKDIATWTPRDCEKVLDLARALTDAASKRLEMLAAASQARCERTRDGARMSFVQSVFDDAA